MMSCWTSWIHWKTWDLTMKNKHDNIAEYILYLWQIEDYLRAFPQQAEQSSELQDILHMMQHEGIMDGGHTQLSLNALDELEELHRQLLDEVATYRAAIIRLQPALNLLKAKTDRPTMSDLEACFTLLYQVMLLRLQKREITPETAETQSRVTELLRFLSRTYKEQ